MSRAVNETPPPVQSTVARLLHDLTSEHVLGVIAGLLGGFPQDRWNFSPKQRCNMILAASTIASQAQAVKALLIAEADQHNATLRSTGTPAATFIASRTNVSKKQAAGELYDALALGGVPKARDAALDGTITIGHARAVGKAMGQMPNSFTPEQTSLAQDLFVQLAQTRTPDEVLAAAPRIAEQVDPVDADQREAERISREREQAWKDRSLSWWKNRGSIEFKGSLPRLEGEAFTVLIEAYAQQARRDQQDDPTAERVSFTQRRADALIQLVNNAQGGRPTPTLAGDRPVINITLDYHKLLTSAFDAGVLPDGTPLSAGDLRRLSCDANLIPVVLGANSEPLDVGQSSRFVTSPIRKALTLRDKHCAFPNCDTPAIRCDAHHLTPWWAGGPTALHNLVLLCPEHHSLIEPDKNTARDQWKVHIHDDGHPVFTPPGRHTRGPATSSCQPSPSSCQPFPSSYRPFPSSCREQDLASLPETGTDPTLDDG